MATTSFALLSLVALAGVAQSSHLSFKSVTGQTVNLNEEKKIVVLSFSATWAPLASKELPALQRFADTYAGRGVPVYWVSLNSGKQGSKNYASDADVAAFTSRYGLKAAALRDPDQAAFKSLGLSAIPTIVVLDRAGSVALKHVGFDPDQAEPLGDVAKVVDRLLK
jgi:peroxiredoxin